MQNYQHIYIIGAPRSGTTWLQRLVGSHAGVASFSELNLFHGYLRPLLDAWAYEEKINATGEWKLGLPILYSIEERDKLISSWLTNVYQKIAATRPGCTHVLDKHPIHTMEVALIRSFFPAAKFIHIIRDGRQVARSLQRIHRDMGPAFGSSSWDNACWQWGRYVQEGIQYRGQPWYMEVRYEDLLSNGTANMQKIFEFCGLGSSREDAEKAISGNTMAQMKGYAREKEACFTTAHFSRIDAPALLSSLEKYYFHRVNGALLQQLGYVVSSHWWAGNLLNHLAILLLHNILLFLGKHPALKN